MFFFVTKQNKLYNLPSDDISLSQFYLSTFSIMYVHTPVRKYVTSRSIIHLSVISDHLQKKHEVFDNHGLYGLDGLCQA